MEPNVQTAHITPPVHYSESSLLSIQPEFEEFTAFSLESFLTFMLLVLLALALTALCLTVEDCVYQRSNKRSWFSQFLQHCKRLLRSLLNQSDKEKPLSIVGAVVRVTWYISLVTLMALLAGELLSSQTTKRPIFYDTLEDVFKRPEMKILREENHFSKVIEQGVTKSFREIKERLFDPVRMRQSAMKSKDYFSLQSYKFFRNGKGVYFEENAFIVVFYFRGKMKNFKERRRFYLGLGKYFSRPYYLKRRNDLDADLLEKVNYVCCRILETALTTCAHRKESMDYSASFIERDEVEASIEEIKPITVDNQNLAFIILGGGLLFSTMILVLELWRSNGI